MICRCRKKSFPESQAIIGRGYLRFLSQTPAYTARPQVRG